MKPIRAKPTLAEIIGNPLIEAKQIKTLLHYFIKSNSGGPMFDYDDTLEDIRERLNTLRDMLDDLVEGSPQYRELELDIEDLEETEQNFLERLEGDASFDEILEAVRAVGGPEDWQKVREIYESGGGPLYEFSEDVRAYILTN